MGIETEQHGKYIVPESSRQRPELLRRRFDCPLGFEIESEGPRSLEELQTADRAITTDQEHHFCLEPGARWRMKQDGYLPDDVLEIPWEGKVDPLGANIRHVGALPAVLTTARDRRRRISI